MNFLEGFTPKEKEGEPIFNWDDGMGLLDCNKSRKSTISRYLDDPDFLEEFADEFGEEPRKGKENTLNMTNMTNFESFGQDNSSDFIIDDLNNDFGLGLDSEVVGGDFGAYTDKLAKKNDNVTDRMFSDIQMLKGSTSKGSSKVARKAFGDVTNTEHNVQKIFLTP